MKTDPSTRTTRLPAPPEPQVAPGMQRAVSSQPLDCSHDALAVAAIATRA